MRIGIAGQVDAAAAGAIDGLPVAQILRRSPKRYMRDDETDEPIVPARSKKELLDIVTEREIDLIVGCAKTLVHGQMAAFRIDTFQARDDGEPAVAHGIDRQLIIAGLLQRALDGRPDVEGGRAAR